MRQRTTLSLDERLTPDEVAQLLGVTTSTLKSWRSERTPKAGPAYYRIPHKGHRICYSIKDIEAFIVSQRVDGRRRR